jgi:hypothetical protein
MARIELIADAAHLAAPARFVLEELFASLVLKPEVRIIVTYGKSRPDRSPSIHHDAVWIHVPAVGYGHPLDAAHAKVIAAGTSRLPAFGVVAGVPLMGNDPVEFGFDAIATAFHFLSGADWGGHGRDEFGRPRFSGSVLASSVPSRPPVNVILALLIEALRKAGAASERRSLRALCVTHDHDVDRRRFAGRVKGVVKRRPRGFLPYLVRGADTLSRLLAWERDVRVRPTVFAWGIQPAGPHDMKTDTRMLVKALAASGLEPELALHASYYSDTGRCPISDQIEGLVAAGYGAAPVGIRMHALRFDPHGMGPEIERARLTYDSSIGYVDAAEFATGFTYPHRLYDANRDQATSFIEVPLFAMDETFRKYLRASGSEFESALSAAGDRVVSEDGVLTLLFHHHMADDAFAPGYGAAFRRAVEGLLSRGLESKTVRQASLERLEAYRDVQVLTH